VASAQVRADSEGWIGVRSAFAVVAGSRVCAGVLKRSRPWGGAVRLKVRGALAIKSSNGRTAAD
jgi:hypothetical protein